MYPLCGKKNAAVKLMQKQTTLNYIFLLLQQQQQQQQFRAAAVDEYNARASPCRQVRDYVPCKEKKKKGGDRGNG